MSKGLGLFIIFVLSGISVNGQYVQIGEGTYSGMVGGPFYTSTGLSTYSSRFAYIFPSSVLGNMTHGDTITSLEFARVSGPALNNSCNLKIFLTNTANNDFGTGFLSWNGQISGLTAVYNQNPSADIGTTEGFHRIPLSSYYVVDTTKGDNLEMLVEFRQTAAQSGIIEWYFENSSSVSGYSSNQTKSVNNPNLLDSLTSTSDYHPTVIFNYPRYDKDFSVVKVYSLGKLPVPLGNPDSVKALVRNVGKKTQNGVKLKTWLTGVNTGEDSTVVSLDPLESTFVNIPSLNPQNTGLDTVHVSISGDANSANDHAESYRYNNANVYSYRDVTKSPAAGGIGFNGTSGDFVARFFSNKAKAINQVSVQFFLTGRQFRIGIWEESSAGNTPGKLIYLSDSLITKSGTYILDLKKPVSINGTFFVGVRQLGTLNVAFGYQEENPVRPNTFYYTAPAGDTSWFDFYPDAPFKFLIEPRLQGDTDLAAISADYPRDTIDRHTTDTLAPRVTIANIGAKDLLDSFDVTCEISFYGKIVYKQTLRDTLSSGLKRTYTFPKKFYPTDFGEHRLRVFVKQVNDQIPDNDSTSILFYVGVKKDVMVATVFDPPDKSVYEYLLDTILPVATIQNPGYDNSILFNARCRIMNGTKTIYNQVQSLSLPKFNSRILFWPVYRCTDTGRYRVVFTVEMAGDVYKINDTIVRNIDIIKSWDLGIDSVYLPAKNSIYHVSAQYQPIVRVLNDGILDATDAVLTCRIKSSYSSTIYYDTIKISVNGKNKYLAQFNRKFIPDRKGLYEMFVQVRYPEDRVGFNDSLKVLFHVGNPFDYRSIQVMYPKVTDTLSVGAGAIAPVLQIQNNGYEKNKDVVPVIFQIWRKGVNIYNDIKSLNLDTGQIFSIPFTGFNPQNSGEHKIIAYTNYVSDVFKKNDSVISGFYVTVGRDASVEQIISPLSSDIIESRRDSVWVKLKIGNAGTLKMNQVRTYSELYFNNQLVDFQKKDDSLMAFESKDVQMDLPFIPQNPGVYRLLAYTYASDDQNIFNDSIEEIFTVIKSVDATVSAWNEPTSGSVILHTGGSKNLSVTINQLGSDTNKSISGKVYFSVSYESSDVVFEDTASFSGLDIQNQVIVMSPGQWSFAMPAYYKARAIVKTTEDRFAENDTLFTAFEVRFNSVKVQNSIDVFLYPNPVNNEFYVYGDLPIIGYRLYDMSGKKVEIRQTGSNSFTVEQLSPGMYSFEVETPKGRKVLKFIRN